MYALRQMMYRLADEIMDKILLLTLLDVRFYCTTFTSSLFTITYSLKNSVLWIHHNTHYYLFCRQHLTDQLPQRLAGIVCLTAKRYIRVANAICVNCIYTRYVHYRKRDIISQVRLLWLLYIIYPYFFTLHYYLFTKK